MSLNAKSIWRDYVTDGVPASGKYKVKKPEVRAWGGLLEQQIGLFALLGADETGIVDSSAVLASAVASYSHLRVPAGTYLIDEDVTIPAGVTVEFDQGAVFNIGTGVTLTWNGGIIAGPYQQIFSGDLDGIEGSPQIEFCTPYWFGAKGDDTQDDLAFILKAHAFWHCFVPKAPVKYLIEDSLVLTVSDRNFWGNGDAWFHLVSVLLGAGEVFGILGSEPTVSGDLSSVTYVENVDAWGFKIECDPSTYVNNNGVGVSFAKHCRIFDFELINIGRKAATCQFFCDDVSISHFACSGSNMESGTASAVTIEGMFSGFNFANGEAAWDAQGADMNNVVIENWTIDSIDGAEGGVTLSNVGKSCRIGNGVIKSMTGRVATLVRKANGTIHDIEVLSPITRAVVFTDANATGKVINVTATQGASATEAALILAAPIEINAVDIGGCTYADMITAASTADRVKIRNSKLTTSAGCTRLMNSTADDTMVDDCEISLHSDTVIGLQFGALRPRVSRNKFFGGTIGQILCTAAADDAIITENQSDLGTATMVFQGDSLYSAHVAGNTGFNSAANNLRLGGGTLWRDATVSIGKIRTNNAIRTSDTDGVVVGTQS